MWQTKTKTSVSLPYLKSRHVHNPGADVAKTKVHIPFDDLYQLLMLSMLGRSFSRWHFEIFFSYFSQKIGWHYMQVVRDTICMKSQILFAGKNKKKTLSICHLLNLPIACCIISVDLNPYYLCLASHKRDIGKHCRPRSDATECDIWSGSTLFSLYTGISTKHSTCNNKN